MQARESRISTLQAERDGRREPLPAGSAPQQPPAARAAIDILSRTETSKTRPCGIIAPERTQRLSSSPTLDLHLSNRQTWPMSDHGAYKYTVPQNTAAEYVYPQRNISPRQTFQENMRRILVPPSSDLSKLISEPNPPQMTYPFQLNQPMSKNSSSEPKYCEVPYIASQISKQQRSSVVRNNEVYTSNVGVPPLPGHGWPSAVPPTPPVYYPPEYYGHQQSYATAARSKVPVKKSTDQLQHAYSENLCRSGDVRFEPYHTTKDKYPRARYEYVNFPNSYHSYVLPPQKYDSTKPVTPPFYVNYTPQKYVDPRIVDPRIADSHPETYVRPTQYLPGFTTQHPEYISSKFVPPSTPYRLPNKFYGHPLESGLRHTGSNTKSSYEPSKLCYDQDYGRSKPLQTNESTYVTEMLPYGLRGQVPLNNYPLNNAPPHGMNHMYQYRNDNSVKSYSELMSQYKHPDIHTSTHNPLARIPAQFSPNVISPSESNTSMESVPLPAQHEDCGYVSQCSTTSGRSIDYSHYKLQHNEHSTDNRSYQLSSTSATKLTHKTNTTEKHTKNIDIRQFLQTWDEDDDDDCTKAKDKLTSPIVHLQSVPEVSVTSTTSEPPLYVLGYVNIPSDEIGKYEHIQKVCKLPENIRGYDSADLLNKFDEAFRPSTSKNFAEQTGNNSKQVIKPINESIMSNVVGTARAPSPFDVEAKITQSVIHKDVGCNFEIKPFSPPLQNVETSMLSQNTNERKIEKIFNPNIAQSIIPNSLHHTDDSKKCAVKRQSLSSDEQTSNSKVMKTVDSQFSFNNTENKQEVIGKDFSTLSGMCLASLPRLDNEMELNFQEINEQYCNLKENHESVIISTPNNSLLLQDDQANSIEKDIPSFKTIQNQNSNINNDNLQLSSSDSCFYDYNNALPIPSSDNHCEKNPMKLSKIRRNKSQSSVEIHTINTPQNSPMQRTDSVIIKNPDNIENNSQMLEDLVKLPQFVKQTSSIADTKQSSQSKSNWSSESLNQSHNVSKCDDINHENVTIIHANETHFTEILPLPGSKSPINLIMHSHSEEYTNCIRPSLIHCTSNESDNINDARKSTDYVNSRTSENINSEHSKNDTNEMSINVAINLSINSNQSDLYSVNNSECRELKEIDKNEGALVSVFKENNIKSPSNQTGEPKENDKSTSSCLNSHELTLQCFNQANVYLDESNITLSDKENSKEYMTTQMTHEKRTNDMSRVQKQFNENNIVSTKTDCNEDLHPSSHSDDQPDILVDGNFENDKPVDVINTANIGNSVLLLDSSEHENSCTNESINGYTFMTNSISDNFNIKSPLKVIDSDDQLEENIENIARHIMASGNIFNNTEKYVNSDIHSMSESSQLQDPLNNSLHNNEPCGPNRNEVILHDNTVHIESEKTIKAEGEMEKDNEEKDGESNYNCAQVSECGENEYQNSQIYNKTVNNTYEEISGEEKLNEEENIYRKLENSVIETPSCLQTVSLDTETEKEDNNYEQSSKVPEDIENHKVTLSAVNNTYEEISVEEKQNEKENISRKLENSVIETPSCLQTVSLDTETEKEDNNYEQSSKVPEYIEHHKVTLPAVNNTYEEISSEEKQNEKENISSKLENIMIETPSCLQTVSLATETENEDNNFEQSSKVPEYIEHHKVTLPTVNNTHEEISDEEKQYEKENISSKLENIVIETPSCLQTVSLATETENEDNNYEQSSKVPEDIEQHNVTLPAVNNTYEEISDEEKQNEKESISSKLENIVIETPSCLQTVSLTTETENEDKNYEQSSKSPEDIEHHNVTLPAVNNTHEEISSEEKQNEKENISSKLENIMIETPSCLQTFSLATETEKKDNNYEQSSKVPEDTEYHKVILPAVNNTYEEISSEEKQNEKENISSNLENIMIETPSCLQTVSLATDTENEDNNYEQSSKVPEDIEDHKVILPAVNNTYEEISDEEKQNEKENISSKLENIVIEKPSCLQTVSLVTETENEDNNYEKSSKVSEGIENHKVTLPAVNNTCEESSGEEKQNEKENISSKLENIVIETPFCLQTVSDAPETEDVDNNYEQSSKVPEDFEHHKVNLPSKNTLKDNDSENFGPEFIHNIKIYTADINISNECELMQEIETECKSIQEVITVIDNHTENSNLSHNLIKENTLRNDTNISPLTNDYFTAQENKSEVVHKCVNNPSEKCEVVSDVSKSKLNHDFVYDAVLVSKVNLSSDNKEFSPPRHEFKIGESPENYNKVCNLQVGYLKDKITEENLFVSKATECCSEVLLASTGSPKGNIKQFDDLNNKSVETTRNSTVINMADENIEHPTPFSDVNAMSLEQEIKETFYGQSFENLSNERNLLNNLKKELHGSAPIIIIKGASTISDVCLSQEDITNQETQDFIDVVIMNHTFDHETAMKKAINKEKISDSVNTNLIETSKDQFENNDTTIELNNATSQTKEGSSSNFLMNDETGDCYKVNKSPKNYLDPSLKYTNVSMNCEVGNIIISSGVVLRDETTVNEFTTDSKNEKENSCIKPECYNELHETTETEIITELPACQKNLKKVKPNQNMQQTLCNDANLHNEDIIYECDKIKNKAYANGLISEKVKNNIINNNMERLSTEEIFECCKDYFSISEKCASTEGRFDCDTISEIYIKGSSPKNLLFELNKEVYGDEPIIDIDISSAEVQRPDNEYSLKSIVYSENIEHSEEAVPKNLEHINELTKVCASLFKYEDEKEIKNESDNFDNVCKTNVDLTKKCIRIADTSLSNDSTTNMNTSDFITCNISKEIHQSNSKEKDDKNKVSNVYHKKYDKHEIRDLYSTPPIIQISNNKKDVCSSNTMNQTFSKSASFNSATHHTGIIFDTYFSNKRQNSKNSNLTSDVDDFIKSQMSLIKNKNRNTRWDKKCNANKGQPEIDTIHEKSDCFKKLDENSQSKIINNLYAHCQLTSKNINKSSIGKQETPSELNNTELSSHLSFIFDNLSRKRRISYNCPKDMKNECSNSNVCQHKQGNNYDYMTSIPVTKNTPNNHPRNINKVAKLFFDDKESEKAKRIKISEENKIERNIDSDTYLSKWINIDNENITSSILGQEKQIPTVVETFSKTNKLNEREQNVKQSEYLTSQEKTCFENNEKEFFVKNKNNSDKLMSLTNIFEEDIKNEPLNQKNSKENDMRDMKLPVNKTIESKCLEKFGLYDELWADSEVFVNSKEIKLNTISIEKHRDTYSENFARSSKLVPEFIEDLGVQQNINERQSCDYPVVETEITLNGLNYQRITSTPRRNEDPNKKTNQQKMCCAQISDKNNHSEYSENYENLISSHNVQNSESYGKIKVVKIKQNSHELNIEEESLCTHDNTDIKIDMHGKEFNIDYTDKELCIPADCTEDMKEDSKNEGDSSEIKTFAVPIEHIVCMEPDSTQECHGQDNANLDKNIKNIGLNLKQNKELQRSHEKVENVYENIMCETSNVCYGNLEKSKDRCSEALEECDSSQVYEYSNEVEQCKTPRTPSTFFDNEASCNLYESIENQECLLIEEGCIVTDNIQIIDEYNIENAFSDHCSNQDSEKNVLQHILHSPTPFHSEYKVPTSPNDFKNCETSTIDNCEEIWIDDVACIETVVSEEVEQEIDSDNPEYPSPTDVQNLQLNDLGSNDRVNYDLNISFDSTKLKNIYGDNMDNNDIHLVETLYRTPHMDVRSKLNESECKARRSKQKLTSNNSDENSQDRVTFAQEINKDEHDFNYEFTRTTYPYSNTSHNKQADEIQASSNYMEDIKDQENKKFIRKMHNDDEKCAQSNLPYNEKSKVIDESSPRLLIENVNSDSNDENYDQKCSNVSGVMKYDDKNNCPSDLSHKKNSDRIHKLKTSMSSDKVDSVGGKNLERIDKEHFQIQTYQTYTHSRILDNEHTEFTTNLYLRADIGDPDNTKKIDSNCLSRRTEKLITKAAQKYVPPLKISTHNLKVQLPLPQENLRRLQHLKIRHQEHERSPIPKLKIITSHLHKNNVNLINKKMKPKFEDVLKDIDDAQFKLNVKHRNKKKSDKVIPKVIIKKNGSQYTSTSPAVKPNFNPDLTGSRWQPCVSLERYPLIDKMLAKRKTKVTYCSLTGKFIINHKSYKIKNSKTAPQYSIEGIKEKPLKCTIMLN